MNYPIITAWEMTSINHSLPGETMFPANPEELFLTFASPPQYYINFQSSDCTWVQIDSFDIQ